MRKKILFVTHALESLYGAATSLRLLLSRYASEVDADILLPRSLRQPRDLAATAKEYGLRNAYELSLPVDLGLVGVKRSLSGAAHGAIHWASWQRDRARYREILARNRYDIVHLNSTALHALAIPEAPFVAHIREIVVQAESPAIAKLKRGLGTIFIDGATRTPFQISPDNAPSIILNNPVDMSDIAGFAGQLRHPRLESGTTVFSMVGQMYDAKGDEFVIRAYRLGAGANTVLLIVGAGSDSYVDRCRKAAEGDPRVIFWGEEKDIKKIYAATDYVVRGEAQHCVGRTVYEGLYAGCRVLMPGLGEPSFLFEADRFGNSVAMYRARDIQSLADAFAACSGMKAGNRTGYSNIDDYARSFDAFLDRCLTAKGLSKAQLSPGCISD